MRLASQGNAAASGLGDIKDYWKYKSGKNRLKAGEYLYFERDWGFTVDTKHEHVRYVFHTCWHGVGENPPVNGAAEAGALPNTTTSDDTRTTASPARI